MIPDIRTAFTITLFAAAVLLPFRVGAQEACVTFRAEPSGAALTLLTSPRQASRSPGSFCLLTPGRPYYMQIESRGYETRRLRFSLGTNGQVEAGGGRTALVGRSVFVPGWGQIAAGHPWRGSWSFLLQAISGFDVMFSYLDYQDEQDLVASLERLAAESPSAELRDLLEEGAYVASLNAETLRKHVIDTSVLFGYLYVQNLVETFMLTPSVIVSSVEGTTLNVSVPLESSTKAQLQSLFFPGMGQKYLGSQFQGWLFQTTFLTMAWFSIDARKNYNQATDRYTLATVELDNATTEEDILQARVDVESAWNDRRDEETIRNIFYAATGAVWAINMIDILFVSKPTPPPERWDIGATYSKGQMWTQLTVRF